MAAYPIFFSLILSSLFTVTSQYQQHEIADLHEAKLKIARLESVLEESVQKLNAQSNYLKERESLIDDLAIKIQNLQSLLLEIKDDSSHAQERVAALEEEVRLLWAVCRQNNFDLHIFESKARDAEDRLDVVTSQVEKMADVVTEQWIQIQHLEQALYMAEVWSSNVIQLYIQSSGSEVKADVVPVDAMNELIINIFVIDSLTDKSTEHPKETATY